ncbi:MAG: hypothetical protein NC489_08345 [Ruminococcus flavefaciens]|nr:hypothetical protein [Ruminococcus flavefaciens]
MGLYTYTFNLNMDNIEAVYFDGSVYGVNRIKDFIASVEGGKAIESVEIIPNEKAKSERDWPHAIKDCSVKLKWAKGSVPSGDDASIIVKPGEVLISKVRKFPTNSLVIFDTIPGSILNRFYNKVDPTAYADMMVD